MQAKAGALSVLPVAGLASASFVLLILETPFWVAGAAESMEIGKLVIGASNKSGRRCMPSDEINLIYLMYLDLSGTKRRSFWRHRFG